MTILLLLASALIGAWLYKISLQIRKKSFDLLAREIIQKAEQQAKQLLARADEIRITEEQKAKADTIIRETALRSKEEKCERERKGLQERHESIEQKEKLLRKRADDLSSLQAKVISELEQQAHLTLDAARQKLEAKVAQDAHHSFLALMQKAEREAATKTTELLIATLNRMPQPVSAAMVALQDQEMKARLIGRDGKNIKAFQEITGTQLLLDDNLTAVISSFDAKRREVAKLTLELLCNDGRVTFQRIEEAHSLALSGLQTKLMQYGKMACERAQVTQLHPELLSLLGSMQLLTTQSQNLLEHSIEVSLMMNLISHELGLNAKLARRIGLLHDIGKAAPMGIAPTHAKAGYLLALQYGEDEKVANGIGAHHDEIEPITIEAMLCKPCDALSAARIGARMQAADREIERAKAYEAVALTFSGVHKAFAIQGNSVLQVFVKPDLIDEGEAQILARDIANKLRAELSISRPVQVRILRELNAIVHTA